MFYRVRFAEVQMPVRDMKRPRGWSTGTRAKARMHEQPSAKCQHQEANCGATFNQARRDENHKNIGSAPQSEMDDGLIVADGN